MLSLSCHICDRCVTIDEKFCLHIFSKVVSSPLQFTKDKCSFSFQYICYPWKNDTMIDAKNRRKTCRIDSDCDAGQECFRHHDKRMVNRGLCFDEVRCYS